MRLWPGSLAGRVVLVLVAGLLVAQLFSAAILLRDRGSAIHEASGVQAARAIAGAARLLDGMSPAQRGAALPSLNSEHLRVALSPAPLALEGEREHRARAVRHIVRRALGERRPVEVVMLDAGAPGREQHPARDRHEAMRSLHLNGADFIVQVQLSDGQWALFEHRTPQEVYAWPQRLLLGLGILLVSVLALSLLAVRWLTRPLAVLGEAADALGRDIHRSPLPEAGPAEVRRAARAFNRMQDRLIRYLQDRERMLGAVSHDLRTPITRLRLRAEMLEDEALRRKFLADLGEMEAMVAGTLEYMRAGQDRESVQAIDVNALLESLAGDRAEMGQAVRVQGAAHGVYAGRPLALKRCLDNLVDNALKHGGVADITVGDDAQALTITVADAGPGLPEAELERVFEPFYRPDVSRSRDTGGSGLGLAIARSIARVHGGEVVLRNRPEGGLAAMLRLPR